MTKNIVYNRTKVPFKLDISGVKTLCLPNQGICKNAYPLEARYLEDHNRIYRDLKND